MAFPRNPYHHLVKHYQDRQLQVGHANDPEQDARLALQVLADQIAAFARLGQEAPYAALAYHHLMTRGKASGGSMRCFNSCAAQCPVRQRPISPSAAGWMAVLPIISWT